MKPVRRKLYLPVLLMLLIFLMTACVSRHRIAFERGTIGGVEQGIASWYGEDFHGKPTASGEIYDMHQLTCAHKTLPLGTMVMVTNLENGKSVELKVNDRGPFVRGRIIDVSYAAAQMLDMYIAGTAPVRVEVIGAGSKPETGVTEAKTTPESAKRFTLQVGAFVDESNAQRLAEQLRKDFDNVRVTALKTENQTFHRVRVGQFNSREDSMATAEKLSHMGFKVLVTNQ